MNRKETPYVSVVMAVYNGETYLHETVSSILRQTVRDFEYIIINDGSTDETGRILTSFTDPRIILIHSKQNRGLAYSLNRGLAIAQGRFVARMDVGDWAVPERLEKQVTFLEAHPEIGIVGSPCVFIDKNGVEQKVYSVPLTDLEIRWTSLLRNPFVHPPVMIRRDILCQHRLNYDTTFQATQDYELWTRLLQHTRGANWEEPLLYCRVSETENITSKHRSIQLKNHDIVALRTIRQELPEFEISQEQVSQLRETFIGGSIPKHKRGLPRARLASLYLDLLAAFARKHRNHPEMKALQRRETLKIGLMVFHLQFFSYWFPILKRAVRLYPGFIYPLFRGKMQALLKRLWRKGYRFLQKRIST